MKAVPSPQSLRYLRSLLRQPQSLPSRTCQPFLQSVQQRRYFHQTPRRERIETHILSDIGEGVKEVQIIQWFVEEGAQIEEWGPLCEVQSDKAAVEITSKYSGVIKKLHFGRDAVVQVGDAMLDIEVEGDDEPAQVEQEQTSDAPSQEEQTSGEEPEPPAQTSTQPPSPEPPKEKGKHASLATPAVRGMLKEHNLAIESINGTGKDGRVLKEDILKHLDSSTSQLTPSSSKPTIDTAQSETPQRLTPVQSAMFKSMTKSLQIPHFLYSDSVDFTSLSSMRKRLNHARGDGPKYSFLPFIVKAVSLAMNQYPILNARLDTSDPGRPQLQMRSNHNIGIAMDTPAGLLVPVIKSVNARSIASIAQEIARLGQLGQAGKLSNDDLSGGTITVTNIGSVGGEVVAPVLVEGQLAICGVGKVKATPVFGEDGELIRAEMCRLSWSADHRVVDGATMARAADVVRGYLEGVERMVVDMV
jgi:2-oxoisovalerate dehydrogenase E2 component (dihydrolipoyl transacylase)